MVSGDELATLVRRAQSGDKAAFEALARRFARSAYAVALAQLGRPHDAEDVAQDALLAGLEQIDACRHPERFGGWLMQITRNHALNFVKRRKLHDVRETTNEPVATGANQELALTRRELLAALDSITATQREVVLLHDLDGWTHPEIAAALEITEETSRQHLVRARRALRARLEES